MRTEVTLQQRLWYEQNKARLKEEYIADVEARRAKARARYHANKSKQEEYRKANQPKIQASNRARKLMTRYDITEHIFGLFEDECHGSCLICGSSVGRLVVDHDHKTGTVRGLLCSSCNSGLGYFQDNPSILVKAAAYLAERKRK